MRTELCFAAMITNVMGDVVLLLIFASLPLRYRFIVLAELLVFVHYVINA